MQKNIYDKLENYMLSVMSDSAHDCHHIYRVLYTATDIASYEENIDMDVLIAACLLHDIGREAQFKDPSLCHANVGSRMAYEYLLENGWDIQKAIHVKDCIDSHRYRGDNKPSTIEAKILFDADKLDVTGAIGIARTFIYKGQVSEPIYCVNEEGDVMDGTGVEPPSFMREYNYKLKNIYDRFYTRRGHELAQERRQAAEDYYNNILSEITSTYQIGKSRIHDYLL